MPAETMAAKISYPDAKAFQNIVEALSKIIDEVSLKLTPEGARIRAMDPAKIALIDIWLPSSAFLEYSVEEEVTAGFNVAGLLKLLRRGRRGDRLDLEVTPEKITVRMVGDVVKKYVFNNLEVLEPEIPGELPFTFKVSATILADLFKEAVKDAETVGETMELEAPDENTLYIRGVGAEGGGVEARLTVEAGQIIEYRVEEPCKSRYSIDYLKYVLSLTKVADTAILEFSSNSPLRLRFTMPSEGRVDYLLAPKIE